METLAVATLLNIVYLAMRSQRTALINAVGKEKDVHLGLSHSSLIGEQFIKRALLVFNMVLNGLVWSVIWQLPEHVALFTGLFWTIVWPAAHLRSYLSMRSIMKQHEITMRKHRP